MNIDPNPKPPDDPSDPGDGDDGEDDLDFGCGGKLPPDHPDADVIDDLDL